MKKILVLILLVYLTVCLAACKSASNNSYMSSNHSHTDSQNNTLSDDTFVSNNNATENVKSELDESFNNSLDETDEPTVSDDANQSILVHEHSYTNEVTKNATCSTDGIKKFTCLCGDTYFETIKAVGHKWGDWTTTLEPTTTATGISARYCSVCGDVENKTIPKKTTESSIVITDQQIKIIKDKFLQLVNQERTSLGLQPLIENQYLNSVAIIRSAEITELFSHTRPNGKSCFTAIDQSIYPFHTAGENIIMTTHLGDGSNGYMSEWTGSNSDLEAVAFWMFKLFKESEGHYKNMINASYKECGYGISYVISEEAKTPLFYGAHFFAAR